MGSTSDEKVVKVDRKLMDRKKNRGGAEALDEAAEQKLWASCVEKAENTGEHDRRRGLVSVGYEN